MKRQLEYFMIDGAVGGNQEWFRNVVMYMGGCAAATACDCCIYFARQGEEHLYPYDIQNLTKEDYIQFGMKMKPYIRPRVGGVKKLSMFIEGFSRYLADRGEKCLAMRGFDGSESAEKAAAVIKMQIDRGLPVPYLMLRHQIRNIKTLSGTGFCVMVMRRQNTHFGSMWQLTGNRQCWIWQTCGIQAVKKKAG